VDSFGYLIPQIRAFSDSNTRDLLSVHLEISCPSARSALSAYPEFGVSVDKKLESGRTCHIRCRDLLIPPLQEASSGPIFLPASPDRRTTLREEVKCLS